MDYNKTKNRVRFSMFTTTLLLVIILLFLFNFNFDVFNAGAAPGDVTGEGTPKFIPKWIGSVLVPPAVSNVTTRVSDIIYCLAGVHASIEGTAEGSNLTAYEAQIDDDSDPLAGNPEWESGTVFTDIPSGSLITAGPSSCNPSASDATPQTQCQMDWNTTYRAWMRVQNSGGTWSSWTQMSQFCNGSNCSAKNRWTTPAHSFPSVNFNSVPTTPTVGSPATFTDATTYGPGSSNHSWSWNFGGGSPTPVNTNLQGPYEVIFPSQITYQVTLTATDDVGSCSIAKPVVLKKPLPKWIEILPR